MIVDVEMCMHPGIPGKVTVSSRRGTEHGFDINAR